MENTVIQIGNNSVRRVEDLVASVCYDNHLANYHAIISVPLLATIQSLFRQYPDASLLLAAASLIILSRFSLEVVSLPR